MQQIPDVTSTQVYIKPNLYWELFGDGFILLEKMKRRLAERVSLDRKESSKWILIANWWMCGWNRSFVRNRILSDTLSCKLWLMIFLICTVSQIQCWVILLWRKINHPFNPNRLLPPWHSNWKRSVVEVLALYIKN